VLIEEVKVAGTTAMLQCLHRRHRLAHVLGGRGIVRAGYEVRVR
jgi:hypothetical protein